MYITKFLRRALMLLLPVLVVTQAESIVIGLIPSDVEEYENVYEYEPTSGEMDELAKLKRTYEDRVIPIKSPSELNRRIDELGSVVIIVGHNTDGVFRFPSGEGIPFDQLSQNIEDTGRIPVFLTCKGSCYTNVPSNRRIIGLSDALILSNQIDIKYNEPTSVTGELSAAFSDRIDVPTPKSCKVLMSNLLLVSERKEIRIEIKRMIFRFEANGLIDLKTQVVPVGVEGAGVLVYLFVED